MAPTQASLQSLASRPEAYVPRWETTVLLVIPWNTGGNHTYNSLMTYIRVTYHINDTYDQLILFTVGILWLLVIPPLLVHAIIWYMYI